MISLRIHKILVLVFAAVFCVSTSGVYIFGGVGTALQRRAQRINSSEEEIITLSLSKTEFFSIQWIGDKDFIFNGTLYDMESFSVVDGRYILSCEQDEYEMDLFALMVNQLSGEHNSGPKQHVKSISFSFDCILPAEHFFLAENSTGLLHGPAEKENFITPFIPFASPPPEA